MNKVFKLFFCIFLTLIFSGCSSNFDSSESTFYALEKITNINQISLNILNMESFNPVENTYDVRLNKSIVYRTESNFNVYMNGISLSSLSQDYRYVEQNHNGANIYINQHENTSIKATYIEGGLQILYIMKNKNSTKEFVLDYMLNDGSRLSINEFNEYVVYDRFGNVELFMGQPWAVDADGNIVKTYYEISDNQIKQVIDYSGDNYPITADPLFCNNTISNIDTVWEPNYSTYGGSLKVVPTACARAYLVGMYISPVFSISNLTEEIVFKNSLIADMYDEMVSDDAYNYITHNSEGIKDQFICHVFNPLTTVKPSWNLEPWRPDVSLYDTYLSKCNPGV